MSRENLLGCLWFGGILVGAFSDNRIGFVIAVVMIVGATVAAFFDGQKS